MHQPSTTPTHLAGHANADVYWQWTSGKNELPEDLQGIENELDDFSGEESADDASSLSGDASSEPETPDDPAADVDNGANGEAAPKTPTTLETPSASLTRAERTALRERRKAADSPVIIE